MDGSVDVIKERRRVFFPDDIFLLHKKKFCWLWVRMGHDCLVDGGIVSLFWCFALQVIVCAIGFGSDKSYQLKFAVGPLYEKVGVVRLYLQNSPSPNRFEIGVVVMN